MTGKKNSTKNTFATAGMQICSKVHEPKRDIDAEV